MAPRHGRLRPHPPRYAAGESTPSSGALQNLQTADAVGEGDQAAVIRVDIVALTTLRARRRLGHVVRDLFRRMRMRDVDDAKPLREPGKGHFGAADLLDRLMT